MDVLCEYDFGHARINVEDVAADVEGSPGSYLEGPITIQRAYAVKDDIVVFRNAHDSINQLLNGNKIPGNPNHFLHGIGLASPSDVNG